MTDFPRLIKQVKVYGRLRVQIPVAMARALSVKDGDTVEWTQYSPGSFVLTPTGKYRAFVP